jgi:4-amino-4-deoxy-L-arabinose transferase-like glycosyltransferase
MVLRFHQAIAWCFRHAPILIFAVALCVRLGIIVVFPEDTYRYGDHSEVVRIATSLATKGTFADAYGFNTGPTAHAAPLYPILLSTVFRFFGTGVAGEFVKEALNSFLASLIFALLPALSTACGIGWETGVLAGFAGALLPVNFWSETKGSFEATPAALFLLIFCIVIARRWRDADFSVRSAVLVGITSGVALLLSAAVAPVIIATLFLTFALFRRTKAKESLRFSLVVLGICVLSVTPWVVRNYRVLGGFVWSRSNLGLELYAANSDRSAPTASDNAAWFVEAHPYLSETERAKLRAMGELPYQHEKLANALNWIKSHPKRFAWLTKERIYYFWFPKMHRRFQTIVMALFTLGAAAGLLCLFRSRNVTAWLFLAIVTIYPLIYYLVAALVRYRYPIDWLLIFLTTFFVCSRLPALQTAGYPTYSRLLRMSAVAPVPLNKSEGRSALDSTV